MYIIYCRYIVFKININSLSWLKNEPTQLKKVAKSPEELKILLKSMVEDWLILSEINMDFFFLISLQLFENTPTECHEVAQLLTLFTARYANEFFCLFLREHEHFVMIPQFTSNTFFFQYRSTIVIKLLLFL